MKVELSQAEIGLITALALDDVMKDRHGMTYEIVTTGEKTGSAELLEKFAAFMYGNGPPDPYSWEDDTFMPSA